VIEHEDRDGLARHLKDDGIQTVINYPTALPFLPAYARFGHAPEDFPAAYAMQSRILSLPMFAEISEAQIQMVADSIGRFGQGLG
jgi:dTDP-4-amino-4,6-dideoxygalactose transaminase